MWREVLGGRFVKHTGHTACHSETKTDVSYAEEFPTTVERHSSVTFRALLGALYYGTLSTDRLKGVRDHHPGQSGPLRAFRHLQSTEKLEQDYSIGR